MTSRFTWRHQYDREDEERNGRLAETAITDESLTQQHFKDDVDINVMVRRFGVTDGAIPPAVHDPRYYGDFSDAVDFRTALDRTRQAVERFEALPAELRNRFNNDPTKLFQWVTDPKNDSEAVALGLLKRLDPSPSASPASGAAHAPTAPAGGG